MFLLINCCEIFLVEIYMWWDVITQIISFFCRFLCDRRTPLSLWQNVIILGQQHFSYIIKNFSVLPE